MKNIGEIIVVVEKQTYGRGGGVGVLCGRGASAFGKTAEAKRYKDDSRGRARLHDANSY